VADDFEIHADAATVEGWASRRLPFEPRSWMLDYRDELHAAIRGLHPDPVLYCAYTALDPSVCDVENVLLYNVGLSAFSHLGVTSVVAERFFASPPGRRRATAALDHHHLYRCGTSTARLSWATVATWAPSGLEPPFAIERVGSALRRSAVPVRAIDPAGVRLSIELDVQHPHLARTATALSVMKTLIDGAIASLHTHNGEALREVAVRLATRLDRYPTDIAEELMDQSVAVLGSRRLLWPFGRFVQWNPADDRIVRLRIQLRPGDSWRVSGTLQAVDLNLRDCRSAS
jgi:hypothetical protein